MSDQSTILPDNDATPSPAEPVIPPVTPDVVPPKKSVPLPGLMLLSVLVVAVVAGMGGWYVGMKGWLGSNTGVVPVSPRASTMPSTSSKPSEAPQGKQPAGVACTMDAMQCPDGRWIGRSGPNCEFVCEGEGQKVSFVSAEKMVLKYWVSSPDQPQTKLNIVMPLPAGSQVQQSVSFPESTTFYPQVKINGVDFLVEVDRIPGYCDFNEPNCEAIEETWPNIKTVKRWEKNKAVFALSIPSLTVGGSTFGVSVTKPDEALFTQSELALWRAYVAGITTEVVSE